MSAITWIEATERTTGRNHATRPDVANRPLRDLLTKSGLNPDANPFPAFAMPNRTYNAAWFDGSTDAAKITAGIAAAVAAGVTRLFIPGSMLNFDTSAVTYNAAVLLVREGGPVNRADVKAYGARGDGVANDTLAIQKTIDSLFDVYFPKGVYNAVGLTQSAARQQFFADGDAYIVKNGNGVILASSGDQVRMHHLQFRGESATPAFTGDNVTFSGQNCAMIKCGSRYAFGRAVKATGGHFVIDGTCDIYQTADATGTGYDIEVGVSGTATLYHELNGVYSSQATGGILTVDCGSVSIKGGQFGKLNISSGTSPAGVNGGSTLGARILGNVTVGISNAEFSGCAFGAVAITINASISGVSMGESNNFQSGCTITNNGSANNYIARSVGAAGSIEIRYGHDASVAVLKITPNSGRFEFPDDIVIPNNTAALIFKRNDGTDGGNISQSAADNLQITNPVSGKDILGTVTGTGKHSFDVAAGARRAGQFDDDATAGNTKFLLYDVTAGALVRVSRGASDSGGAGFRALRIPN